MNRSDNSVGLTGVVVTALRSHFWFGVALLPVAMLGLAQTNEPQQQQTVAPAQQAAPPTQRTGPVASAAQAEYARPGSVNYVEGEVAANGQNLTLQSVGHFGLDNGQSLTTASNGYAEVLLTPGAFLRVGPNSEITMTSVGLADTRMQLHSGSVLIEAAQIVPGSHVEVTIDRTSVDLLKKGLYGFAANPPAVRTFDGQLEVVGMAKSVKLGKGEQILLSNNDQLTKTKFDRDQAKQDPLYAWSEARSRAQAAQNKLVAQNSNGYVPVGDGWFWDPYVGYYGFWGPGPYYSPFGFGYYGGYYPGFYGGFYGGGYHRGFYRGGAGYRGFSGVHGNGVGFGGGFHGGAPHGGGGHR